MNINKVIKIKDYEFNYEIYNNNSGTSVIMAAQASSMKNFVLKVSAAPQTNEIAALKDLSHPNIIKLHENGNQDEHHYMVFPHLKNGCLTDFLKSRSVESHSDEATSKMNTNFEKMAASPDREKILRTFFLQLVHGLKACFQSGVCHRDLKPDNILVSDDICLLLSDFDLSRKAQSFSDVVGTESYMAPEILEINDKKKAVSYDGVKADLFGLGVLLFCLTTGKSPFYAARKRDPFYCLLEKGLGELFWRKHGVSGLSQELSQLIENLLSWQPSKRFSIDEILLHPWCKGDTMEQDAMKRLFSSL